ncbi:MAG TPA: transglutaminase family protein [Mycobacteriales bacterium]|nr:transglutaminase family protein [Mycobacteriales bacterium]
MTARLEIRHTTRFTYRGPKVTSSYNEARLTPQTTGTQATLESAVTTRPAAATTTRYRDYWGTLVTAFDLHEPHDHLEVLAHSLVETSPPPPLGQPIDWDALGGVRDRYAELLATTAYAPTRTDDLAVAAEEVATSRTPLAAVHTAVDAVRDHLDYDTGSTGVRTTAVEAWEARSGVCQDFAHVTLALLRSAGIPARYVSGYLHPVLDAPVGTTVVGQSHAWVEAWVGEWTAVDPTNGSAVAERHVRVANGRDYADVSPLRGVYTGAAGSSLEVTVEVTRLR